MEVNSSGSNTSSTNEEIDLVEHEYSLDVPVSQSDVHRWRTLLHSVEPSPNVLASLHRHLAFHTTPNMTSWTDNNSSNTHELDLATIGSDYGIKSVQQVCAMQQSQEKTSSPTQIIHPLAPFPIFNSNAVMNLPMTRLLKLRREWLPHRQQFAAYQQRTQLLECVLKYSVVAVVGIHGSGKTLQIPSIISETEAFKRRRVIVCCANTISAQLTSLRLRQERGEDADRALAVMTPSFSNDNTNDKKQSTLTEKTGGTSSSSSSSSSIVGLVLPSFSDATEGSSVIVTVADILIRQLMCDPTLSQVGCVIVDDLHLRDAKMELCLAALRELVECQEKMINSSNNSNANKEIMEKMRLRVILNCVDEHTSGPLLTFFANTRITSLSLHSSSSSLSSQGSNVPILYLEETIQWITKCNNEGSALCRNPDAELASYSDRVDVMGKVMASAEADFNQPQMLQSYWCDIILETIKHFTQANIALRASTVLSYKWIPSLVLVIVPNDNAMSIIHNTLKRHLELEQYEQQENSNSSNINTDKNNNDYGTDEVHERSSLTPHYVFTMLNDAKTSIDTFWRVAQGKECSYQLNQNNNNSNTTMERKLEVHVLFITPELALSALPASLSLGLVIDCARSSWCEWDAHGLMNKEITEFASLHELRVRRNLTQRHVLSMISGESHTAHTASSTSNTNNNKTVMESVSDGLVMFIQLIPKSILHSAQHRRMSNDPTQHRIFHLSLEEYAFMYLYLQLRKHVATLASSTSATTNNTTAVVANNDIFNSSTIPNSIHILVSSLCVAAPASTSHCYDLLRRNFECAEKYLLNSGLLRQSSSSSSSLATHNEVNTMSIHLTPLGLLVIALPLPMYVNRLLLFASVCNCVIPALVMAAVWLVGDPFAEGYDSFSEHQENEKFSRERRALVQEARLFFARESRSDMVSEFNLFKMWLMIRSDENNAADIIQSSVNEEESAFLSECGLSKSHLEQILRMTGELYKLMCRYHLIHDVSKKDINNNNQILSDKDALNRFDVNTINKYSTSEIAEAIATVVKALPEDIAMHGSVQACVTLALYPHVAITHEHRRALLLDEVHMTNANQNELMLTSKNRIQEQENETTMIQHSSRESWKLIKRLGVFEASSVMNSSPSTATNTDNGEMNRRLMMYVHAMRPLTLSSSSTSTLVEELQTSNTMVLLFQATPLHVAGAIVSAHSIQSHRVHQRTNRCRGWSSLLTLSWRRTSRARLLPPPATQLPQVCIQVQAYDTIHSPQLHLMIDHGLKMTTRESTLQWLRSLQGHIQLHLYAMAMRQIDAEWDKARESSQEIGHAWEWWSRRESNSAAWLREERAIAAVNQKGNTQTKEENEQEEGQKVSTESKERQLYPYYEFLCVPGLPAKVDAPAFIDHYYNNTVEDEQHGEQEKEKEQKESYYKKGTSQRNVYTGKRPSPDLDEIIKTCVRNIAANHTREAEAQLLRDNQQIFFFLDPDNEFHEYYLFLLRQAAPEMEVLGDNLEELVEVLQQLEIDLRVELGLPTEDTEQTEMSNVINTTVSNSDTGEVPHTQHEKNENEALVNKEQKLTAEEEEIEVEEEVVVETELIDEEYDDTENNDNENEVHLGVNLRHTYDIEHSGVGVQFENASVNLIRSHGLTDTRNVVTTATTTINTTSSNAPLPTLNVTNTQSHEEQQSSIGNFTFTPTSTVQLEQASTSSLHPSSSSSPLISDATIVNTVPANTTSGGSGTGQTLMEKLMAMRQGSTIAPTTTSTSIVDNDNNNNKMSTNTKMKSQMRHSFDPTSIDVIPEEEEENIEIEERENGYNEEKQVNNAHSATHDRLQQMENNGLNEENPVLTTNVNNEATAFTNNGNVSIEPNFIPPTSAELFALLAVPGLPNTSPTPPPTSLVGGNANNVKTINPLTKPPPPLPSKVIDERAPSVVVYPLPDKKYGNIPLILARALGERLGLRVGPTKIVGNVARIDVPNRKVEARALSLKYFTCVGRKVYLFRNDRIIDNPNPPQRRRKRFMSQKFASTAPGQDQVFTYNNNNNNNKQNTSFENNSLLPPSSLPPSFVQPPPPPHRYSPPHYSMNINANNSRQSQNNVMDNVNEPWGHDASNSQVKEDGSHINVDNNTAMNVITNDDINAANEVYLKIGVFSDSDDEDDDENSSVSSDSTSDDNSHKDEDDNDNIRKDCDNENEENKKNDKELQEQKERQNAEVSKLSTSSSQPLPEEEQEEYEQGLTAEKQAVAQEENEEVSM